MFVALLSCCFLEIAIIGILGEPLLVWVIWWCATAALDGHVSMNEGAERKGEDCLRGGEKKRGCYIDYTLSDEMRLL